MGFYFICYVIVGMCFGIAGHIHLARMEKNQAGTGEMFAGDELIKSDLEFCKSLTILTSDEWIETLQTNNWDFWDETFK